MTKHGTAVSDHRTRSRIREGAIDRERHGWPSRPDRREYEHTGEDQ